MRDVIRLCIVRGRAISLAVAAALLGTAGASAQPAVHPDQPLHVFFDWNSAKLSGESLATLDAVVAARVGDARIDLAAFSDRSGPRRASLVMARRRAEAARDYLLSKGVAGDRIGIRAYGASHLLIATERGVREAQNRRVDIVVRASGKP